MKLALNLLKGKFAVAQLPPDSEISDWMVGEELIAIVQTQNEFSIVCEEACVPDGVKFEPGWRALMVQGPLDFSLVGVLAEIASTLAAAKVSIFSISTYNTDYILIKEMQLEKSIEALNESGYRIEL